LRKYARIYALARALARALVMLANNLGIFPTVQLEHKYACIYVLINASGIKALLRFGPHLQN
jgi:hypothetical protein